MLEEKITDDSDTLEDIIWSMYGSVMIHADICCSLSVVFCEIFTMEGKPKFSNCAVFFNIVQTAFAPPPPLKKCANFKS